VLMVTNPSPIPLRKRRQIKIAGEAEGGEPKADSK